jgi:ethanolamine utilization protein EutN
MLLARVIGTVVSTRKDDALVGFKLLVIEVEDPQTGKEAQRLIAVDSVGAGVGERVLVTLGGAARVIGQCMEAPTDATIVGIVDTVDCVP